MSLGETFKIVGDSVDDHLWMVISNPCAQTNKHVLVNLTGWKPMWEKFCVVEAGEHEYVKKKSVVYYPSPRLYTPEYIKKLDGYKLLKRMPALSSVLLKKIQIGAIQSPHFPIAPKQIMKTQFEYLLNA